MAAVIEAGSGHALAQAALFNERALELTDLSVEQGIVKKKIDPASLIAP